MKRLVFALITSLVLVVPGIADDKPSAEATPAAKSLVDQLKENPDDRVVVDKYMSQALGELRAMITSDPDGAEARLDEMKTLFDSLQPQTDAGKQLIVRAKQVVPYYQRQVELGRLKLEDLIATLKENPDDVKTLTLYRSKLLGAISPLARSQPLEAETMVTAARELLAEIKEKAESEVAKSTVSSIDSSLGRLDQSIAAGKKLAALVGSDATALSVEGWVNGEPLSEGDLKGKVVLLDFWAVWCGPCIATFPHLREWHEQYAEEGLVIIGLTRKYGYLWDDQTGRPKRAENREEVTTEQESEMLGKFAEQHNLHHRLAIQQDRTMAEFYAVTGIPHVVLIDREGKVQLIRVGSGEQNAKDISDKLAELIADR